MTLRFSPGLPADVDYSTDGLIFLRGGPLFSAADIIPVAGLDACAVDDRAPDRNCRFTNSNGNLPAGTAEFVGVLRILQSAADVANVGTPLTISLFDGIRTFANAAAPGDEFYQWENQNLVVNITNPIITRTTDSPIEIAEGASGEVIFTRSPAIGNGDALLSAWAFRIQMPRRWLILNPSPLMGRLAILPPRRLVAGVISAMPSPF